MILEFPKHSKDRIAENFWASEFDCHCARCNSTFISLELLWKLQMIRSHFGVPLDIISGFRCTAHNAECPGAASNSQHIYGKAADITVLGVSPVKVSKFSEEHFNGMGYATSFTHIDVRGGDKARWTY